jgi:hypothetical protein
MFNSSYTNQPLKSPKFLANSRGVLANSVLSGDRMGADGMAV